jgi:PAS domain-containing protein
VRGVIRLGGAAAGIALLPVPAYALDTGTILLPPALFLLAAVAVAAIILQRLARRLARVQTAYAGAAAALRDMPAGYYLRRADGSESFSAGTVTGLSGIADLKDFTATLAPADGEAFAAAFTRLKSKGEPFALETRLAGNGATIDLFGRRLAGDAGEPLGDVVWLVDGTARAAALAQGGALRQVLDALALPVWRRGRDLALIDGNRAYAAAVDAPLAQAIAERREFAASDEPALAAEAQRSTAPQSANRHIVIAGARRLMEVTEAPLPSGEIVGWARDVTDRETAETELARHIGAHAAVLENTMVAIAIYGPDMRLSFFNTAFAQLWQLEPEWLAADPRPNLDEVIERLRERRRLPEYIDFRAFRQQQRALFT